MSVSQCKLSNDSSTIYAIPAFGSSVSAYLIAFNATSGAIIGSRYKSSSSCSGIFGSALEGNVLAFSTQCSGYSLLLYNILTSFFTIKQFAGALTSGTIDYFSQRFTFIGTLSGNSYLTKFQPESIIIHPNFSSSTLIMNILAVGVDTITSESGVAISAQTTITASSNTYTNQPVTYIQSSYFASDIQGVDNSQSTLLALEGFIGQVVPLLLCSSSGSSTISFSIGNYNGQTAPIWILINSSTGILSITAPSVNVDTEYYFYINSLVSGFTSPIQQLFRLTILNCIAQNCLTCSNQGVLICAICNSGFILNSGACVMSQTSTNKTISNENTPSQTAEALATTTLVISSTTAGVVIAFSMINTSSLSSLWSMINQNQIFFLLLLTRAFIPQDVKSVIIGTKFFSNPISLIPFQKFEIYQSILNQFDFELSNPIFDPIGLNSDSSIYNTFSFFLLLILFAFIHSLILIFKKLFLRCNDVQKCKRLVDFIRNLTNKIFMIMTFGYYIRYVLQMNQYLLITSVYEIYNCNISQPIKIISFITACAILILLLALVVLSLSLALSSYKTYESEHNKIGEFFRGVKMQKKDKFYASLIIIRRSIFVLILIIFMETSSKTLIILLSFIQMLYVGYVSIIRPYILAKNNVIEIINEIYFLFLLSMLIYLNAQDKWNSTTTSIYTCLISSNSMAIMLIVLIDLIRIGIAKIYNWISGPPIVRISTVQYSAEMVRRINQSRVHPETINTTQQESEINHINRNERYKL